MVQEFWKQNGYGLTPLSSDYFTLNKRSFRMKTTKIVKSGAIISTYENHPVISLPLEGDKTLTFGQKRAKAVVANLTDIVAFTKGEKVLKATVKKYKGKPILTLAKEGKPFSFGMKKAEVILAHAGDVINFSTK
jgi:hypothetical protein